MLVSTIFLSILSCIWWVQAGAACSGTVQGDCGSDCYWLPGSCTPLDGTDCNDEGTCRVGCKYTAPVQGSCVDSLAETCATGDSNTCGLGSLTGCTLQDACVDKEIDCTQVPGDGEPCAAGCVGSNTWTCELFGGGGDSRESNNGCEDYSTTTTTLCESEGCTRTGTVCSANPDPEGETDTDFCALVSTATLSECNGQTMYVCKASGESCVVDTSFWTPYCALLSATTSAGSPCTFEGCRVVEGDCVPLEGEENEYCEGADITPITETQCEYESDGFCKKIGTNCVVSFTPAEGNFYCAGFSTEAKSPCSLRKGDCKAEGGTCRDLTAAERCAQTSVAPTTECALTGWCKVVGTACKGEDAVNDDNCEDFSTVVTTACELNHEADCVVNADSGLCELHVPTCVLKADGSDCDEALSDQSCSRVPHLACANVAAAECSSQTSFSCSSHEYEGTPVCEWKNGADQACQPATATACGDADAPCSLPAPPGCTSTAAVLEACDVDASKTTCGTYETGSTCPTGAGAESGCKWQAGLGGHCVAKNCSNSPSYTTCCPGGLNPCAYCVGTPKPAGCPVEPGGVTEPCIVTPSYATCCPGTYCAGYCGLNPSVAGCENVNKNDPGSASSYVTPFFFLFVVLFALFL